MVVACPNGAIAFCDPNTHIFAHDRVRGYLACSLISLLSNLRRLPSLRYPETRHMAVVPAHTSEFPAAALDPKMDCVLPIATVDKKPELSFIGGLARRVRLPSEVSLTGIQG